MSYKYSFLIRPRRVYRFKLLIPADKSKPLFHLIDLFPITGTDSKLKFSVNFNNITLKLVFLFFFVYFCSECVQSLNNTEKSERNTLKTQ